MALQEVALSCYRVLPHALPPHAVVERADHLHLEPRPQVVAVARQFVRERLPALPDADRDAVMLMTSELVTNAVIHARTPFELGITVSDKAVLITVHDLDITPPVEHPIPERDGGRGLDIVRALADAFDMQHHLADGKTAWFRVPRQRLSAETEEVAGG